MTTFPGFTSFDLCRPGLNSVLSSPLALARTCTSNSFSVRGSTSTESKCRPPPPSPPPNRVILVCFSLSHSIYRHTSTEMPISCQSLLDRQISIPAFIRHLPCIFHGSLLLACINILNLNGDHEPPTPLISVISHFIYEEFLHLMTKSYVPATEGSYFY